MSNLHEGIFSIYRDDFARAIRQRDAGWVTRLMFERDRPTPKSGFRTETDLWDFKADCPRIGREWSNAWADTAAEVLSFHNHAGGVLVYGIGDNYSFTGSLSHVHSCMHRSRESRN